MNAHRVILAVALTSALGCKFPEYEFPGDTGPVTSIPDAPVGDGLIFPTEDAGIETCSPNACGGCAVLTGTPDSPCESCGKLTCETADKLTCVNGAKNECGGCTVLSAKLGASCGGSCGVVECDGMNAVKCSGATTPNACGGCASLAFPPGTACNIGTQCGGLWTCEGTEKVSCIGGHAFNDCGGCKTLTAKPGASCGTCGKYVCNSAKESVSCSEASPAAGSYCSLRCPTSRWTCDTTARTTACKTPDEGTLTDTQNTVEVNDENGLCKEYQKAVSFKVGHQGQITKLSLKMGRRACICGLCGTTHGDVVVSFFQGTPTAKGIALGTGRLNDSVLVDGWHDFTITGSPVISKYTDVFFEVRYLGNYYTFAFYSSLGPQAGHQPWFIPSSGPTSWDQTLNFKMTMLACK